MRALLILILLGLPSISPAGTADAEINGKTESGRTEFALRVDGIDGLIRSVRLTIDGESYSIKEAESLPQTVIWDRDNGIYVVFLKAENIEFKLWMIPNSEKIQQQANGVYRSRFAAILEATDPRKSDGSLTPRITIGCSLDWEI